MKCHYCGTEVTEKEIYCRNCGTKQMPAPQEVPFCTRRALSTDCAF